MALSIGTTPPIARLLAVSAVSDCEISRAAGKRRKRRKRLGNTPRFLDHGADIPAQVCYGVQWDPIIRGDTFWTSGLTDFGHRALLYGVNTSHYRYTV